MPHKGDYSKCRFCPKCGVESLQVDRYREGRRTGCNVAEYICGTCGFGFRITNSARVAAADLLFSQHRKLRGGKFEQGVPIEVAEKWVEFTEDRHERWQKRLEKRGIII
jgi:predicted RNA-binding Zn-ribbon protein involved in translation (DUF1610 family)